MQVKRVYSGLLDSREERWAQARGAVADTLTELAQFYSGDGALARRLADDSLAHWLAHLADQVHRESESVNEMLPKSGQPGCLSHTLG